MEWNLRYGTLWLAMLVSTGCPSPVVFDASDEAAIRKVLDDQKAAWNAADIETFMEGYHRRPDIVFTSSGKVRRGFDETLAAYTTKYVDGAKMGTLDFREVEITALGAEAAVVLGHWELTDTPEAAAGVFSLVFSEDGGAWKVIHDHTSATPKAVVAAAPDPAPDPAPDLASPSSDPNAVLKPFEGAMAVSETEYKIERAAVDELLNDPAGLARQARIVPVIEDDAIVGFKLFGIRTGSVFSALGLRNGDQISAVNGQELRGVDDAMNAYVELRAAKKLIVELVRRGKPLTMTYTIE